MSEQKPLIHLENIKVRKGSQTVEVYSSTLFPGLIYQIQGPNGAGKSLLLDVFAHEQSVSAGTIYYEGRSGSKKQYLPKVVKKSITYIRQGEASEKSTPLSTLLKQLKIKNISKAVAYRTAMEILEDYGLQPIANQKMSKLSPGTRRKVELLKVLTTDSKLIIIDDPAFDSLDDFFVKKFTKSLQRLVKNESRTLVVASPQSLARLRMIDITLVMNKGHIIRVEKTYQRKQSYKKKN